MKTLSEKWNILSRIWYDDKQKYLIVKKTLASIIMIYMILYSFLLQIELFFAFPSRGIYFAKKILQSWEGGRQGAREKGIKNKKNASKRV